jgi:hypothetical protein
MHAARGASKLPSTGTSPASDPFKRTPPLGIGECDPYLHSLYPLRVKGRKCARGVQLRRLHTGCDLQLGHQEARKNNSDETHSFWHFNS